MPHTPGPWKVRKVEPDERSGKGSAALRDIAFLIEPLETYPYAGTERELWAGQGGPPAFTIARIPFNSGATGDPSKGIPDDAESNAQLVAASEAIARVLLQAWDWCTKDVQNEDGYPSQKMMEDRVTVLTEALQAAGIELPIMDCKKCGMLSVNREEECPAATRQGQNHAGRPYNSRKDPTSEDFED